MNKIKEIFAKINVFITLVNIIGKMNQDETRKILNVIRIHELKQNIRFQVEEI
jgi:hypothetical protein